MQCPKCSREYSPDTSYCDACSVMLEPIEINATESTAEAEHHNLPDMTVPDDNGEILDDIKIDSLKTEIELTFISTLLLELTQLKKRLPIKKDNPSLTEVVDIAFQPGASEGTSGDEHIQKRIDKLEAILYNLDKKIEADISDLQRRLNSLKKPGLTGLLTDNGRIYRMLSSELKTKYAVQNSIQTRVPASVFQRFFRPSPVAFIALTALIAFSAIIWIVFSATEKTQTGTIAPSREPQSFTNEEKLISINDITSLLEDIKTANLQKDISLWESRYSKSYRAIKGKKENILELWSSFDYISLDYRIDQLNIRPETVSARITWDMKLRSRETGKVISKIQTLSADFVRENKTFKISAVRQKGLN